MGLFGFGKKKEWDLQRSNANKAKMKDCFSQAVADASDYQLIYAYNEDVKGTNFSVVRVVRYQYKSIVVGYRESDMSLVLVDTTPEFEEFGEVQTFTPQTIKKASFNKMTGSHMISKQGGLRAGYVMFDVLDGYDDEKAYAYLNQEAEIPAWNAFWEKFSGR